MAKPTYYQLLDVGRGESAEGIRAAYLRQVRKLHPDHAGGSCSEAFRRVQEAWDVLSDPGRRRGYDLELRRAEALRPGGARFMGAKAPDGGPPCDGGGPERRRHAGGEMELRISREVAARGGTISSGAALPVPCPACRGRSASTASCPVCGGGGVAVRDHRLRLEIPAGARTGTVVVAEAPDGVGEVPGLRLRLVVDHNGLDPPPGRDRTTPDDRT